MDRVELWDHIERNLPESVRAKIDYVYERVHYNTISVAFIQSNGYHRTINIKKSDWLNDAAVARLCLECP